MKYVFFLMIVGVLGFVGYKEFFYTSEAFAAYKRFSDAMAFDQWDAAEEMAGSSQVEGAIDEARNIPKVMGHSTYRMLRGTVHWGPTRDIKKEDYSDSGDRATFVVVQELRRGPPTMPAMGPATVRHRQEAVLVKTDDGWVVDEFYDEIEDIGHR